VSPPRVTIRLEGNGRTYLPGETLEGEYHLEGFEREEIKAVEVSVLWYTEGKGDEDMAVHYFRRLAAEDAPWEAPQAPGRFSTKLPLSPLSYNGLVVKVVWCVRVRVFLARGKQVVGEHPFRLGSTPSLKAIPR